MEEKNNGEQLLEGECAGAQIIEKNEEERIATTSESSQFGKFKNAEDLFSAYQNLEAEFTKKSQRLSSLEKEQEQSADNTQTVPAFETKQWFKTVQDFYENNPKAKGFEKEISSIILGDKQIANSKSPLECAWQQIASKNFKSEDELANDNDFLNKYVLNNPQIQENVLKTYLEKKEKAPSLIASSKGKQINIAVKSVPKNLEQARGVVEKLFS